VKIMISKGIPKMKREIIIELERVTIIEQKLLNQDLNEVEENEGIIEVEAKEVIETENRVTPKNEEKNYEN
jgi:hypothetical protein